MLKIFFVVALMFCQSLIARDVQETTYSYWANPDIQIYYSVPPTISKKTKIMFIIHGASRKAERNLNNWLPLLEGRDVVVIASEFSKEFYN